MTQIIQDDIMKKAIQEISKYATNVNVQSHDVIGFEYANKKFLLKRLTPSYQSARFDIYSEGLKRISWGISKYELDDYLKKLAKAADNRKNVQKKVEKQIFKEIQEYLETAKLGSHTRIPSGYRLHQRLYNIDWKINKDKFIVQVVSGWGYTVYEVSLADPNFDHIELVKISIQTLSNPVATFSTNFANNLNRVRSQCGNAGTL